MLAGSQWPPKLKLWRESSHPMRVWGRLSARARAIYLEKLRRDVQRLAWLQAGLASPTRPELDRA